MVNEINSRFSVLMSVYKGDTPEHFNAAIESVVRQSRPPDELVLVKDGPLGKDLNKVIERWRTNHPNLFSIVSLEQNIGLGPALKVGMEKCSHDIVARMDADDISLPNRFEEQLRFLVDHPETDVVSCWLQVFDSDPNRILFETHEPTTHEKISRVAKFRSPIAHGTVMYRRAAVIAAGGYHDWPGLEDYELWVRMLRNGSRLASIPKILYKNRRDMDFGKRRRGFHRMRIQISLQRKFLQLEFVSPPRFVCNVILRTVISFLPYGLVQYARFKLGLDQIK